MTQANSNELHDALTSAKIELPADQVEQLDQYCQLLWLWNEKLNLTRHTDYEKFVTRDVIDVLQIADLLEQEEEVLDVGSGGGVPGIILAIVRPDLQVSLCDSMAKKAKVLNAIVEDLNLPIPVYHGRAEDIITEFRFDSLVTRAVGPLWKILFWFKDDWHSIGRLLAIKGPKWIEERAAARERGLLQALELRCIATYPMPGTESESVILQIQRRPTK